MNTTTKQWLKDALERVAWSIVYAAISAVIVISGDLSGLPIPNEYKALLVAILTPMLNTVKVIIAKKVGDPETASIGGPSD